MPSSDQSETLQQIAEALVLAHPVTILDATGGGNNRLYKVRDGLGHLFALKSYPAQASDPRDRLGTEFAALDFMTRHSRGMTPRAIAYAKAQGFALYEWIEGEIVRAPNHSDIDQMVDFMACLRHLGAIPDAGRLPLASEACLSAQEIVTQVTKRRARFAEVAETEPELAAFLTAEFDPLAARIEAWCRARYQALGWDFRADLDPDKRALSPSDFGFHNALKGADGNLVFIDFEYFGWDDPVKLTADFLQHPGMSLDDALQARFKAGAVGVYGKHDPAFAQRLDLHFPLIGLRWCMILLNEFLPERWYRRQFAGTEDSREIVIQRQLAKARHRAQAVADFGVGQGV